MAYAVILDEDARKRFLALDNSVRKIIGKKLVQLEREDLQSRHLKRGAPVFIEEVGQYRIVFKKRENEKDGKRTKEKLVVFVGDHKHYKEWYSSYFKK